MTPGSSKASEGAMRKLISASLFAVALLLVVAAPSDASGRRGHWHGGTRVFVGVGPAFWYGPYPYWYYPPPYYYTPPPVIIQEPPVYIQQQPTTVAPLTPPVAEAYWYYCASAKEYYPRTPTCPEAWIQVPPRP
jgi:hypothetical protein